MIARSLAVVVALGTCGAPASSGALPTHPIMIDGKLMIVEVASTQGQRARGLMFRPSLAADAGMLFVYPDSAIRRFWMKDTRVPLSIAFIDDHGEIKRIADMQPLSTDRTSSLYPVRYALEVNQGWFAEHEVEVGDTVTGLAEAPVTED